MILALGVALQILTVEVDISQIAGRIAFGLIVEMLRGRHRIEPSRGHCLRPHAVAELHAGGVSPVRRVKIRRARNVRVAGAARLADQACGRLRISVTGKSGSATAETNEELAPFSRSRRTR